MSNNHEEEPLDLGEVLNDLKGINADFFNGIADNELTSTQEAEDKLEVWGWTRIGAECTGSMILGIIPLEMFHPHGSGGGKRSMMAAAANDSS